MKKQLVIVGIVVLLLAVGLSGCTDETIESNNEDNEDNNFPEENDTEQEEESPLVANIGDTIPDVGIDNHNLSMTILSWKESNISVFGPYVGNEYYTFTAKEGRTFIILIFEFQNDWIKPQNTPYLTEGDITTDKGNIYPLWKPPSGTLSQEYDPRMTTEEELNTLLGDSGGYEELFPEESTVGRIVFEILEGETPIEASIKWVPYLIKFD